MWQFKSLLLVKLVWHSSHVADGRVDFLCLGVGVSSAAIDTGTIAADIDAEAASVAAALAAVSAAIAAGYAILCWNNELLPLGFVIFTYNILHSTIVMRSQLN